MQCPRCGFDQPDAEECISCGIVIAKYVAAMGDAIAAREEVREEAEAVHDALETDGEKGEPNPARDLIGAPPKISDAARRPVQRRAGPQGGASSFQTVGGGGAFLKRHSLADEPIGTVAMAFRGLASVLCLIIAVVMVSNGEGLKSPWPYIILISYASAALWGLTTIRQEITTRSFAVEMAVLVGMTLVLRTASPEMFAVEPETVEEDKVVLPHLPKTPVGRFAKRCLTFVIAGQELLELSAPATAEDWKRLEGHLDFSALKREYALLGDADKATAYEVWGSLKELGGPISGLMERYGKAAEGGAEGAMTVSIPDVELRALSGELKKAVDRAERLRSSLLVY